MTPIYSVQMTRKFALAIKLDRPAARKALDVDVKLTKKGATVRGTIAALQRVSDALADVRLKSTQATNACHSKAFVIGVFVSELRKLKG